MTVTISPRLNSSCTSEAGLASILSAKSDRDAPRGSRTVWPWPRGAPEPMVGAARLSNSWRRCLRDLRPRAGLPPGRPNAPAAPPPRPRPPGRPIPGGGAPRYGSVAAPPPRGPPPRPPTPPRVGRPVARPPGAGPGRVGRWAGMEAGDGRGGIDAGLGRGGIDAGVGRIVDGVMPYGLLALLRTVGRGAPPSESVGCSRRC